MKPFSLYVFASLFVFVSLFLGNQSIAQNPGEVATPPLLWLKADAGIIVSDGKVEAWQDQSPNGFSAEQIFSAKQPSFLSSDQNGKPSVVFGGTQFLKIDGGILGDTSHNEFRVFIVSSADGPQGNYLFHEGVDPQQFSLYLPWDRGWRYEKAIFFDVGEIENEGHFYTHWGGTYNKFHLWNLESSVSKSRQSASRDLFFIDDDNEAITITGQNQDFGLGAKNSGALSFEGKISEIIIYNKELPADQVHDIETYLYEKYGLGEAWLNDQYSHQAEYAADIVGLGRNDTMSFLRDTIQSGPLKLSFDTDLVDQEFLIVGHDQDPISRFKFETLPNGYQQRIAREWRFDVNGVLDSIELEIDLVGIADWPVGDFGVVVDSDKDFSDGRFYPLTRTPGTTFFTASDIDINDDDYLSIVIENDFEKVYPITSIDNFSVRNRQPDHATDYPLNPEIQEWVYWTRTGPNPWEVEEKMNFRLKFPADYDSTNGEKYPMMIFLSGCGEMGKVKCSYALPVTDPLYDGNSHNLDLHDEALAKSALDTTSFPGIVFMPQGDFEAWETGLTNPEVSEIMDLLIRTVEATMGNWPIERNQVYIHGLSNGGKGVWDFVNRRPDLITAALPMSAVGNSDFEITTGHMPIWLFQGELDINPPVNASRNLKSTFDNKGANLRYTEYAATGHNTWDPAYQEPDFYSWMRKQDQRNVHVFFGETNLDSADNAIELGIAPNHLEYQWYRNDTKLTGATSNRYIATAGGEYHVRFTRYNGEEELTHNVLIQGDNPINLKPIVSLSPNQILILPENEANLVATTSDPDGSISSTLWRQLTGPSVAMIDDTTALEITVSGLVVGTYTFEFEAIDNLLDTTSKTVVITVVPNPDDLGTALFRLNVGGTNVTDPELDWEADSRNAPAPSFSGNSLSTSWNTCGVFGASNNSTNGPNDLFCPYRKAPSWGALSYKFPLQNGTYFVELFFAERILDAPEERYFSIELESQIVEDSVDLFAEAGKNVAIQKSFQVEVLDGILDLKLNRILNDVLLSGIEIRAGQKLPIVTAGPDQEFIEPQSETLLMGSAIDVDGTIISTLWSQVEGPTDALILLPDSLETTVNLPLNGTYWFKLIAIDDLGGMGVDTVAVTRSSIPPNEIPVVQAGADQTITLPLSEVFLTATASDNDGEITSTSWEQTSGPSMATVVDPDSFNTLVTALEEGTYVFSFTATDDRDAVAFDTVSITINPEPTNQLPIVSAGNDFQITLPTDNVLAFGAASDPDGVITTVAWSQVSGPSAAEIENPNQLSTEITGLSEGQYVFKLTVQDDDLGESFDEMLVTVLPSNQAEILYRVNVGGTLIDNENLDWSQDQRSAPVAEFTGNSYSAGWNSCPNFDNNNETTAPDRLFCSYRRKPSWGSIKYEFPVDNGTYTMRLFFAERIHNAIGDRVFDVLAEDNVILNDFDVFAEAGNSSLVREINVEVIDGALNLELESVIGEALLNGIEIVSDIQAPQNYAPIANAGTDQTIQLPINSTTIQGSGSDSDGIITSYAWNKIEGGTAMLSSGANPSELLVSDLEEGVYVFEMEVTDNLGATGSDQVIITVLAALENNPPNIDAGIDIEITEPLNYVILQAVISDIDGVIISSLWEQISGPNTSTIFDAMAGSTLVEGLVLGTYVFKVTAIDDDGLEASDEVEVKVSEEIAVSTALYRVNAGGSAIADGDLEWSFDTRANPSYFLQPTKQTTSGWNYSFPNNTTDAPANLFGTYRYQPTWTDPIAYDFPVVNGTYEVKLYFAEKSFSNPQPGERNFDVKIEGITVLEDLDIAAEVGAGTLQKNFQVVITDGVIDLDFVRQLNHVVINGIEIISIQTDPAPVPEFEALQQDQIKFYPNPFQDLLKIDFAIGENDEQVSIDIFDQSMRRVSSEIMIVKQGQYSLEINLSNKDIAPGMYLINISTESFPNQIGRVVKE